MISLTEAQVGRLLVGQRVVISVGEPWDFVSPDGDNVLLGTIEGVRPGDGEPGEQEVRIAVTPFAHKGVAGIDRLVAKRRYKESTGIIERLAAGEDADVNLGYSAPGAYPNELLVNGWLIGGVRLAPPPERIGDAADDQSRKS